MKHTIRLLILSVMLVLAYGAEAQKTNVKKQNAGGPGVGASTNDSDRQATTPRSSANQKKHPVDSGEYNNTSADRSGMGHRDGKANANNTREKGEGDENGLLEANTEDYGGQGNSDPAPSNTAAINQTTTSQSGSPAVPMNNANRDGTNNTQRATMNMAGSPVKGNMNLDKKNVNPNDEYVESIKMRQGEIQSDSTQINSKAYKRNQAKAKAAASGTSKGDVKAKSKESGMKSQAKEEQKTESKKDKRKRRKG